MNDHRTLENPKSKPNSLNNVYNVPKLNFALMIELIGNNLLWPHAPQRSKRSIYIVAAYIYTADNSVGFWNPIDTVAKGDI